MKRSTTAQWRRIIEEIDQFCSRCNDGLMVVAIVLAIIISLLGAFRSAEAIHVPERFAVVGTT